MRGIGLGAARWVIRVAVVSFVVAVGLPASPAAAAGSSSPVPGILGVVPPAPSAPAGAAPPVAQPAATAAPTGNLTFHGGAVMHTNRTYAIYWSPAASPISGTYESLIDQYLGDVAAASGAASNVYASDTQYGDASGPAAYSSTFAGAYVDTHTPIPDDCSGQYQPPLQASGCVVDTDVQAEVSRAIAANAGWTPGPNAIFFVFTPKDVGSCVDGTHSFCSYTKFCAYHSDFQDSQGRDVVYANMPYATAEDIGAAGACSSGDMPNGNLAADSAINLVSHEHNEAITDPYGDGWHDAAGNENGDKCAWQFGKVLNTTVAGEPYNQAINGHFYELQMEWSNASSGCVQRFPDVAPPGPSGFVTMYSDGDGIGMGIQREFDSSNAQLTVTGTPAFLTVHAAGGSAAASDSFDLTFAAPPGGLLVPGGVYTGAIRGVPDQPGHPIIRITGNSSGCNTDSGRFEVKDIATDSSGLISRLWLVYEQFCESHPQALWGEVKLGFPGSAPVDVDASIVRWPDEDVGLSGTVVPVTVRPGAGTAAIAGTSIAGPNAADFAVTGDGCSGRALATIASCQIDVRFGPAAAGTRLATLEITDTAGDTYAVALQGFGRGGTTRATLSTDSGTYSWSAPATDFSVQGDRRALNFILTDAEGSGKGLTAEFDAGVGDILTTGTYGDRDPSRSPGPSPASGMYVALGADNFDECHSLTGSFTVDSALFGADETLASLALDFAETCDGSHLTGTILYDANDTTPPAPWMVANTSTAGTSTDHVTVFSDDDVSGGIAGEYDSTNALIVAQAQAPPANPDPTRNPLMDLLVGAQGGTGADWTWLEFIPPAGQVLTAGTVYTAAVSPRSGQPDRPAIGITGNLSACNSGGEFEVKDIAVQNNAITRLWILYEQWCGGAFPIWGEVRIGEPESPAAAIAPTVDRWPAMDFGGVALAAPATFTALTSPATVTDVAVEGPDAADFVIREDGCSGKTVAVAVSCQVWLRFVPRDTGTRVATLHLSTSTGSYDTLLEGFAYGGTTRATVTVDPGALSGYGEGTTTDTPASVLALFARGGQWSVWPTRGLTELTFDNFGGHATATFTPPGGQLFRSGATYDAASGDPFFAGDFGGPGICVELAPCNGVTGSFTVDTAAFDAVGDPTAAQVSFVQHYKDKTGDVHGTFSYRAGDPTPPPGWLVASSPDPSPPAVDSFFRAGGLPASTVTVNGHGLAGTTAVRIGGVPAEFTVITPTQLVATVPAGAASGPIAVTTPAGTAASAERFTVGPIAPDAPRNVVATAGDGQALVAFDAPVSDGGAPITSYTVTAEPGGATVSGHAGPLTVTGLRDGVAYRFSVTATNAAGTGGAAIPPAPVTPLSPTAPTIVSVVPGSSSVTVTWVPPAPSGPQLFYYTVAVSPGTNPPVLVNGGRLSTTITGLTKGTAYTFVVTGYRQDGTTVDSASSAPAIPGSATCAGSIAGATIARGVSVAAGKTCVLLNTAVGGNVTVGSGSGLLASGATVGGYVRSSGAAWIDLEGDAVTGSVTITGTTGTPPADVDPGAGSNRLCGTAVGGSVTLSWSGRRAPFVVGTAPQCTAPLHVGGSLQVKTNAAPLSVGGNAAGGVVAVSANTGGGALTGNSAGSACRLSGNTPPIAGSANTAGAGEANTCNRAR